MIPNWKQSRNFGKNISFSFFSFKILQHSFIEKMKYCDKIFFFIFNFLILVKFSTTPEYENADENIEKSLFFVWNFRLLWNFWNFRSQIQIFW
jgi:hypothetical protein